MSWIGIKWLEERMILAMYACGHHLELMWIYARQMYEMYVISFN